MPQPHQNIPDVDTPDRSPPNIVSADPVEPQFGTVVSEDGVVRVTDGMPGRRDPWRGVLLLDARPGTVLYVGPGGPVDHHAHHAVQLTVGLDAPVQVRLGEAATISTRAVIVGSGVPHEFAATGDVAMLYADPSSVTGSQLERLATLRPPHLHQGQPDLPPAEAAKSRPATYLEQLIAGLGIAEAAGEVVSARIADVLAYVEDRIRATGSASLGDAARQVALSPSRLTQVFTREVGIPFRRYALWFRLVVAIETVSRGDDLTRAAAAAGFSDSAHLSRTFRANFGLPPSALLRMRLIVSNSARSI